MLKVKQYYYDIKHTFSCIFKFIGTECDVTQPITDGKIECKTDAYNINFVISTKISYQYNLPPTITLTADFVSSKYCPEIVK
jgi:hypothetical protein